MRCAESACWPGNVRELANVIEHATILCDEVRSGAEHLPMNFRRVACTAPHFKPIGSATLREIEMQVIQQTLDGRGNKPKAAEELGISLKTLYNKLNRGEVQQSA